MAVLRATGNCQAIGRQASRQVGRQACTQAGRQAGRHAGRQAGRWPAGRGGWAGARATVVLVQVVKQLFHLHKVRA